MTSEGDIDEVGCYRREFVSRFRNCNCYTIPRNCQCLQQLSLLFTIHSNRFALRDRISIPPASFVFRLFFKISFWEPLSGPHLQCQPLLISWCHYRMYFVMTRDTSTEFNLGEEPSTYYIEDPIMSHFVFWFNSYQQLKTSNVDYYLRFFYLVSIFYWQVFISYETVR